MNTGKATGVIYKIYIRSTIRRAGQLVLLVVATWGYGEMSVNDQLYQRNFGFAEPWIWDPTRTERVSAWEIVTHNNPNLQKWYVEKALKAILTSGGGAQQGYDQLLKSFREKYFGSAIADIESMYNGDSKSNCKLNGKLRL